MLLWKIGNVAGLAFFLLVLQNINVTFGDTKKISTETNKIRDVNVDIKLYDKRIIQLEIDWMDNLPNDTSYNVILNAQNQTLCSDMPCSIYGISKSTMKSKLIIPENPMSIVDVMECSYMFGCSYELTVETSNAMISSTKEISIPYCVSNVCSCQHAESLPKVEIVANIPKNDSVHLNWSINWVDKEQENMTAAELHERLAAVNLYKIYFKVGEQTNPSLSWGGKLIPLAEKAQQVKDLIHITKNSTLQGRLDIKTKQEMPPKAVINLQTYVEDTLGCAGPTNLKKINVPEFSELKQEIKEEHFFTRSILLLATIVASCGLIGTLQLYLRRRRRQKQKEAGVKRNENGLSPFATNIEMKENIIYVDKYIEEAQAKGLADVFEIPHHAVHLEAEIGEGAFGRVYRGVAINLRSFPGAKQVVAVKQLKRNPSADEIGEFLSEIEMLKSVGTHRNIVCFLGCCTIRSPYFMIMEYVARGNLLSYLRTVRQYASKIPTRNANYVDCKANTSTTGDDKTPVKYIELKMSTQSVQSIDSDATASERQPKPSLSETTYTIIEEDSEFEYVLDHKELHNFALQIANGMRFLEEQEIVHRDLAARNVLIDDRKTLKISDFGLSRHGIYTNTKTRKLPLRWLSIEAIRDNVYSNKSDVWAFGVVLWEIGTLGASPYPTISNHELIPHLLAGKRLDKPEICTQPVYNIMLQCWDEDPNERPSFEELYKALSPEKTYVDINSLSDDYVFPPIKGNDDTNA